MNKAHFLCGLWMLTLVFSLSGCILMREKPVYAYLKAREMKPFDAIIVPGLPYKKEKYEDLLLSRIIWSYVLYKKGYTKNIIYSGGANYTPYHEALIMGQFARQLGVPAEHIFYDTLARHSTENVYYSYLLAKSQGFKKIALATDRFQSSFLHGFIKKRLTTPVYKLPIIDDSVDRYRNRSFNIQEDLAWVPNFVSIEKGQSFISRMLKPDRTIDWSKHRDGKLPPL